MGEKLTNFRTDIREVNPTKILWLDWSWKDRLVMSCVSAIKLSSDVCSPISWRSVLNNYLTWMFLYIRSSYSHPLHTDGNLTKFASINLKFLSMSQKFATTIQRFVSMKQNLTQHIQLKILIGLIRRIKMRRSMGV